MNWYIFPVCSFFPNSINSSIRLNSEKTDVAITATSVSVVNIIAWLTPSFDIFSRWRRALQSPFSWLLGKSVAGSVPSEEYAVWNEFEIGLMHFEISWIKEALFWILQKNVSHLLGMIAIPVTFFLEPSPRFWRVVIFSCSQGKCPKPHQDDSHGLVSLEEMVPIFLQSIP